jgi:hypothetical protein
MISGISGTLTPYGAVDEAQDVDTTFHAAGYSAFSWTTTLNPDGGSFAIPLAAGTYYIGIDGSKWLRRTLTDVKFTGILSGVSPTILPGDLNGDNVIDLNDFSLFATAFGSDPTSPGWNPNADLNCDGVVNL